MKLDEIDRRILRALQRDGRMANNDLAKVSIVSPKPGKRISGRDDCNVDGQLSISNPFLQYYWAARGRRPETAAVTRIKEDLKSLITWP